jgi:hypothetical protein
MIGRRTPLMLSLPWLRSPPSLRRLMRRLLPSLAW